MVNCDTTSIDCLTAGPRAVSVTFFVVALMRRVDLCLTRIAWDNGALWLLDYKDIVTVRPEFIY